MTHTINSFTNTLAVGDCVSVMNAMPERSVDLVFADPPYNLQLADDLWRPDQTKVAAVNDEWDQFQSFADYDKFTREWLSAAHRIMKPNASLWVMGSYHNIHRVGAILQDLGFWIINEITWIKANPTPQMKGTRFCNAHETLLWAVKGKNVKGYTFHYKELKAGNEEKQMRSDWTLPICSGKERIKDEHGVKVHSTQKPEALLHRIIAATSNPGNLIFDPFCGTGTTAAVAKKLGRNYYSCDMEQKYIDITQKRLDDTQIGGGAGDAGKLIGGTAKKLPFVQLVEHGYLKPGDTLRCLHDGNYRFAWVNENGTLTYESRKGEMQGAQKVVEGISYPLFFDQTTGKDSMCGSIHQVGKEIFGLPSCNGWTTWEYYDRNLQDWKVIDNLRSLALKEIEETPNIS